MIQRRTGPLLKPYMARKLYQYFLKYPEDLSRFEAAIMRKTNPVKVGDRCKRRGIAGLTWVYLTPVVLLRLAIQTMERLPSKAVSIQAALARFIDEAFKRILVSIGLRTGTRMDILDYHSQFDSLSEVH